MGNDVLPPYDLPDPIDIRLSPKAMYFAALACDVMSASDSMVPSQEDREYYAMVAAKFHAVLASNDKK